ncbi:PHA/PHB synthase family protein [Ornithinimicrobium cryptoxanthini]|uniref:Alpha/beta fold hydrolase n=1 Tax=Ornithinimicrobium cryptoxanthini TaxID=2934161 RepID=A0ABY4YMD0_9MICO|nr:alpha/beta fold hydrolase [Ornithinimicrobium cryptoxanthini]USQ77749.1 alpha/beta fold hydrolase [Ornithinimicrobium cryptoxanthini]
MTATELTPTDTGLPAADTRSALANLIRPAQAKLDPLGLIPASGTVAARAVTNTGGFTRATARLALGLAQTPLAAAARATGLSVSPPVDPDPRDRRFSDPTWEGNAAFFALHQLYAVACRYADDVLEAGNRGNDLHDQKAAFGLRLLTEALAPVNFPLTNPEVLVKALQTGGGSLVQGAMLALHDLQHGGGLPEKVDSSTFELGRDMAATPGKVVFRNDLVELIQYAPQTDTVHAVPILCSPPWINKYYVMDLAPERSFVEWAIRHGRTVFMVSYRNPDESMRDVTMDDYLAQGVLETLDVVSNITKSDKIDLVGVCLGGAMATMAAAHLAARGDTRLNSLTMMNTLLDYSEPGELGAMTDEETLSRLELRMAETGFLPSEDMALTFDLLRPRDLIFRYIPTRWLQGDPAAPFDILAWNGDSTRMPAAMHATYLRDLYLNNLLVKGEFAIGGQQLDLDDVTVDTYVVGAINDHIVPWTSSYAATQVLGGKVRYILSSGGHIAGIVNPPTPKAWYVATEPGQDSPADPQQWHAAGTRHTASWWEDWTQWSTERAGEMVAPPKMGSRKYRPLEEAPGSYVHG